MKKLIITTALGTLLASSPALAKTEGNYVGIDLINSYVDNADFDGVTHNDENLSFGVNYRYAFNFNNFFVAPEIFYDHNATKSNASDSSGTRYNDQLKYSYGVRLNVGYDITDKFALLARVGHSESRASFQESTSTPQKSDQTLETFIYGLGAKYSVTDNVDLNLAYDISQYGKSDDVFNTTDEFNQDYQVARVGVSYKF